MEDSLKDAGFEPTPLSRKGLEVWRNPDNLVALGLNKKPVNSLDLDMLTGLVELLDTLSATEPRALILTSQLGRVFSAGLDLHALHRPSEVGFRAFWSAFEEMWTRLYLFPYDTVAAIHGAAPAGGAVMALSCDYRIATTVSKIGLNETSIGMVPPPWLIALAERVLGPTQGERAVLSGRVLAADAALAVGYVDEVVPCEVLLSHAVEKAMELSKGHSAARGETKKCQRQGITSLAGAESVGLMWDRVSAEPFQNTVQAVMDRLKTR